MDTTEFRRHAHAFVDWMADYLAEVERYPVRAQVKPGEVAAKLPLTPPERGEPMETIFADFTSVVLPGITHWQHPSFFAYFPANSSPPSVLAEMLTATLGVQCMLWQTSPAATELETRVLDWLRQMAGLPDGFTGVIQDSASSAILCALLTARERATGWRANEEGVGAVGPLRVYCSTETHSATEKGAKIAGLGRANVRKIPVDARFAMRPDALEAAIREDLAAGATPVCVVASLGTTGVGALDPLRPIGEVCRRHNVWLHVDAAMSGSAAVCPELRFVNDGLELADSYCFNPHKWMFVNFDCTAFFVADRAALVGALSILPEYLRNAATESGAVIDYRDWQVQLGRRFRALKLWATIRHYGAEGLRHHVREHVRLAQEFAGWVREDDRFELAAPAPLNLVCFRHRESDERNQAILDRVNGSGRLFLTHTRLDGRLVLRMSIGGTLTERRHVEAAWAALRDAADAAEAAET